MRKSNIFRGSNQPNKETVEQCMEQNINDLFKEMSITDEKVKQEILAIYKLNMVDALLPLALKIYNHVYIDPSDIKEEVERAKKREWLLWLLYSIGCYKYDSGKYSFDEYIYHIGKIKSLLNTISDGWAEEAKELPLDQERDLFALSYAMLYEDEILQ